MTLPYEKMFKIYVAYTGFAPYNLWVSHDIRLEEFPS